MVAESPQAGRQTWIDALRLFAGVSMVGLHVTADAHGQPFPDAEAAARMAPMLLRTVLYMARTELFLMISILLLLMAVVRRPRSYGTVMAQQSRRLLVPFVFWTVFYAGYGLWKAQIFGYGPQAWGALGDPMSWLGFLVLGDVKYHMHFIPTLFALVVFYPLFKAAVRRPGLGLLVVTCLLAKQIIDPLLYRALWGTEALGYVLRASKVLSYLGYGLVAGAVLGLWQRSSVAQRARWTKPILVVIAALFALKLGATLQVIETGRWVFDDPLAYWADYLMPIALMGLCLSLAARRWPMWISDASKYAFGLYLCHPIFLDLAEIALRGSSLSPSLSILLELLWTLPATALFVWMVSRMRIWAWTIGLGPLPEVSSIVFPTKAPKARRTSTLLTHLPKEN